ncbi:hypothetical protein Btru_062225 [Bulinus truncatus]|nr:hypothetical protein Btru_062225 [Bulinus truncatus]
METYSSYEPMFVDKGTEVNDDNTSLAPLSAKSSPGTAHKQRDSIVSLTSIDTIESLSLDFEQAILMGEEAFSADVEATAGYKNEMALFVERMSKIAMQNTFESTDDSTSLSVLSSDNNSDTGSVIRHFRADSKDSESEPGSLTRLEGRKLGSNLDPNFVYEQDWHDVHTAVLEMPAEALPPPPEFNDENETTFTNKAKNEEDEEELMETFEELIVPLGPNGYDFVSAKKVSEEPKKEVSKDTVIKENVYGVFRAEPLAISSMSNLPTLVHHNKPKAAEPSELPVKKEEFVLTNEDLSSISFLPPKVLRAKLPVETTPLVKVSRTSLFLDNNAGQNNEQFVFEKPVTVWNDGRAQAGNKATVSVRTKPVNSMPSMRVSSVDVVSVNEYTNESLNDPLVSRSAPRLLMKAAQGNGTVKPYTDDVDGSHVMMTGSLSLMNSDSVDGMTQLGTSLQRYESKESIAFLKAQNSKWEEQLARNKNLLASQVIEKNLSTENGEGEFQAKTEAKMQKSIVKATETAPSKFKEMSAIPPAPPHVQQKTVVKSEAAKSKPQSKSKFEPQLDPREQLMIAIRNFNGRSSLKTVPVQQTHWYGD